MKKTLELFPEGTRVDEDGQLWLGGCKAAALAEEFGSPLYVLDELTLRNRCRAYKRALERHYPSNGQVAYASKAYLNMALAQLLCDEGLSLDVVSGGELFVARKANFPPQRIHFHGNNKSPDELVMALDEAVGRIVADNDQELTALEELAAARRVRLSIWLRLTPGVDVHTHAYRKTGLIDSKFGFPMATGDAARALVRALQSPYLDPVGLHFHLGSQILELEPFARATTILLDFAATEKADHGFVLKEFSPGGGWGVAYDQGDESPSIEAWVGAVCEAVIQGCQRRGMDLPDLVLEPGRSIVAPAGVALYRVGTRKEIPGIRTYVAVDGGMADNIRPALYGARYTAIAANKCLEPDHETVTIAGRYCESGDVLVRDAVMPRLEPGDLLAIPGVGAYCLAMASNYNLVCRPPVVLARDGQASLIQRRETYADLIMRDLPLCTRGPDL